MLRDVLKSGDFYISGLFVAVLTAETAFMGYDLAMQSAFFVERACGVRYFCLGELGKLQGDGVARWLYVTIVYSRKSR